MTLVIETVSSPAQARGSDASSHHAAWGPILAGAVGGFATAVVLASIGTALGLTVGTGLEDADAEEAAAGLGIGAAVWVLISAVCIGTVAGALLASTAREDRPFWPGAWGTVTWAAGLTLAVLLGTLGSGIAGSMGIAGTAAAASDGLRGRVAAEPAAFDGTRLDEEDAERAVAAAATGAWVLVVGQLIGLASTVVAARKVRGVMLARELGARSR